MGLLPLFYFRLVLWWDCCPCFSLVWFSVLVVAPVSVTSSPQVGLLPIFQPRLVLWWVFCPCFSHVYFSGGMLSLFQSRLILWWDCCPCFSLVWFSVGVVALVSVSSGSLVGLLPLFQLPCGLSQKDDEAAERCSR